jgi:hypothetical protein
MVFDGACPSLCLLLKCCRDDANLWRGRFPVDLRGAVDAWVACLNPNAML